MNWNTEYELALHIKPKAGKKDSAHDTSAAIAITYYKPKDGQTIERSLSHKGYSETFVATRRIMDDERDSEIPIQMYRVKFTIYRSWDHFINDEKKFTTPEGWMDKLEELRKRYKKLDIKKTQPTLF